MRRFTTSLVLMGITWITALSGSPANAQTLASTPVSGPSIGVQFHATWGDYSDAQRLELLDKVAAAGLDYVRVDIGWAAFQEDCATCWSDWQIELVDFIVNEANARGIKVIGTLWRTPDWANGGKGVLAPPTNPADYGKFAGWMADRYRGRVAAWEIWNEPNVDGFWEGTVAQYVNLLQAAYPKIKAADPAAVVLAGAVAHNDTDYLNRMYDAGAKGSFDAISTHPYQGQSNLPPEEPDTGGDKFWLLSHVAAVRSLMTGHGDGDKKIWFTEMGWSSHANTGGEEPWKMGVSAEKQGEFAVRAIEYVKATYPYVKTMIYYNERNKDTGDLHEDNFGMLKRDLSEKPMYRALSDYLGGGSTPEPTPEPEPTPDIAPTPDTEVDVPADDSCTIVGTAGDDVLRGTREADVICGMEGNDVVKGLAGNDIVYGGSGDDYLHGGKGLNVLIGGTGRDVIKSGQGRDRSFGGGGRDRISPRNGRGGDLTDGGSGRDACAGDLGDDFIGCASIAAR